MKTWIVGLAAASLALVGCAGEGMDVQPRAAVTTDLRGTIDEVLERRPPTPGEVNPIYERNRDYLLVNGALVTVDSLTKIFIRTNGVDQQVFLSPDPDSEPYRPGQMVEIDFLEGTVKQVETAETRAPQTRGHAERLIILK